MSGNGAVIVINNIGIKFGVVNTGMGAKDESGDINYPGVVVGLASTLLGLGEMFGKSTPAGQFAVSTVGAGLALDRMIESYRATGEIKQSNLAAFLGNITGMALSATSITPAGAAFNTGLIIYEFGSGIHEAGTRSAGIKLELIPEYLRQKLLSFELSPSDRMLPPVVVTDQTWETTFRESITDWTDARLLASAYRQLEYTNPAEFASDLASYAPDDVDTLDAWFGGWHAGNDATTGAGSGTVDSGGYEPVGYDAGADSGLGDGPDYGFGDSYGDNFGYDDYYGMWPVVIDLDGDGVEINPLTSSLTAFDADGDGYAERSAWVGSDDGLLMIDIGNDGKITDPKEIAFANWTSGNDTDLQGLAATFDSNSDGILDARDDRFYDFRVWHDANSDGNVDDGELLSLDESGIRSLSLTAKQDASVELGDGSVVHDMFDIQRNDGKRMQGADVTLAYEPRGMREEHDANGNLVFRFESGDLLKQRVLGEVDAEFVFDSKEWVGASGNAAANRIDASAASWSVVLDGGAGDDTLKGGSGNDWLIGGADADMLEGGSGDDVQVGGEGDDLIDGGAGRDRLLGGIGNDVVRGDAGDDLLDGGSGDDRLEGGAGDDVYLLNRGDGADHAFDYAEGESQQRYSYQKEVSYTEQYSYYERVRRGSGKLATWVNELRTGYRTQTRMEERIGYRSVQAEIDGGVDTLLFGAGITLHDLVLERIGEDMRVSLRSAGDEDSVSGDSTTIEDWADTRNRIENFGFADGNLLDFSHIELAQHGMSGTDQLAGTASGDFLSGGSGNDSLSGNAGNDVLSGGSGNDQINGGDGKDLLFAGSGNDALYGGAADDYLIAEAGDDQLDGGVGDDVLAGMDGDDILAAGTGDDHLLGGAGSDLLLGGAGDDTYFYFRGDGRDEIFDDAGLDEVSKLSTSGGGYQRTSLTANWVAQYRANSGSTQAEGGNDSLQFGQGITVEDLYVQTAGDDLVIALREPDGAALADFDDQLTIRQWSNAKNRIETFGFIDGRTLQMAGIRHAGSGLATEDALNGSTDGDLLSGGDGNDSLSGLAGADYLIGGAGNDQLDGSDGNDDAYGGRGDDHVDGGAGKDYLFGGTGQDTINGGDDNDVLSGGAGNDLLKGGRGNDVYQFNRGDGQDTIAESALGTESVQVAYTYTQSVEKRPLGGKSSFKIWVNETRTGYRSELQAIDGGDDTLQFGTGIGIGDILLERLGDELRISLLPAQDSDAQDSVSVQGWNTPQYRIEHLRFINDFAVDIGHLDGAASGTAGNDVLDAGTGKASWLGGAAGNDTLNGGSASDVLHGGTGDDVLNGGAGDDVYIFERGDGKDTISDSGSLGIGTELSHPGGDKLLFGDSITIEDLVFSLRGRDMVVYLRDRKNPEASLEFAADSVTITDWATASHRLDVFQFFDGRDFDMSHLSSTVLGRSGEPLVDELVGSAASDWMDGFAGDDTLQAQAGNDYLLGGSGNDTLFGDAGADLMSGGSGDDLLYGGDDDDIAIGGDGRDTINGDAGRDFIVGGAGDDSINGGGGDDVIIGDAGNDTFTASAGTDVYRFGFGDGNDTYIGSEQVGLNGTDIIQLEPDVSKEQLWFERVGDDLVMKLLGSTDSMTFRDWYLSSDPAKNWNAPNDAKRYVYDFEAGGELLSYSKVNGLVSAMAGFAPGDASNAYGATASELPSSVRNAVNNAWVAAA